MPDGDSYVMNAGLVIVAPYIQRLFSILELTKNAAFIDDAAASRQYIFSNTSSQAKNKLQNIN
jgi:hypothetical protein